MLQLFRFLILAVFVLTTYISLDVALGFNLVFGPSDPPEALNSVPLFVLTSIWPAVYVYLTLLLSLMLRIKNSAAFLYFGMMVYVVLSMLREKRPFFLYILAAVLFVLSQVFFFPASRTICKVLLLIIAHRILLRLYQASNAKVDGSFVATLLETVTIGVLYKAWKKITESRFLANANSNAAADDC
jgi:hypothetical protein